VVEAQGGDAGALEDRSRMPRAPDVAEWRAERGGHLRYLDVRELGYAVCALGGGRARLGEEIDPAVGLVFPVPEGAAVSNGEVLVEVHHRGGRGLERARAHLRRAALVGEPFEPAPLILESAPESALESAPE
jgi:pyrimidine-nucleoside phosphorylase/thymidine phosphorylase